MGFLIAVLTIIALALLVLAYVGYQLYSNAPDAVDMTTAETADTTTDGAAPDAATSGVAAEMSSSIVVPLSSLPESQQSVLRSLGYTDSVTFTPEMVTCAEAKLGTARVEEIRNGASPSALEVIKLTPCL